MAKPTPGPWRVSSRGDHTNWKHILAGGGQQPLFIAEAYANNAPLIAAAPRMLDLLRAIAYTDADVTADVVALLDEFGITEVSHG
jgi:hypothetical protein